MKIGEMNDGAISEIIGVVLLFGLTVALFSVLYLSMGQFQTSDSIVSTNIVAYIQDDNVILEHHGGESLTSDSSISFNIGGNETVISIPSQYLHDNNNNNEWDIGEKIQYPSDISDRLVEASVIHQSSNSLLFHATLKDGDSTNQQPIVISTSIDKISPYHMSASPLLLTASSLATNPDNVSLYYRWSSNNESWQTGDQTIVIGNNVSTQGTGSSLEIDKPSGLEDGDMLIAFIVKDDNAGTLSSPAGWTQTAYQSTSAGHDLTSGIWYKIIEDTDDENSNTSYIWTHTDGNEQMTGGIIIIKNVNSTNPLDASTVSDAGTNDETIDCASITTNTNNAMVLTFACKTNDVSSATKPVGTTKVWTEFYSHTNNYCSYYIKPTAGSTGIKTWTDDENQEWHSYQMALKPKNSLGIDWNMWSDISNPDTSSPWSWSFNFPNTTGYYEFYSIGKYDEMTEDAPSSADARCYYDITPTIDEISIWNFDENMGSTAYDTVDGNDGDIYGATWVNGVNESALEFDGINDYVEIPDNDNLDPEHITMMAWIKHDSVSNHKAIIDKRDDTNDGYDLYISPLGKAWLRINEHELEGSAEIDDDTWHHIVGTYDGNEMRLFVDGILDNTEIIGSETLDTSNPLRIGLERNNDFDFNGIIDEVRIYNTAVGLNQVREEYNRSKPLDSTSSSIGQWQFNEGTGTIAFDSINENDGIIHDATWTTGINEDALFFDNQVGLDEYVSIPDEDNLDLTTEGSVEVWIKINSYQDYAGLVHKGNQNDFDDEAYTLQFWNNGRTVLFGGYDEFGDGKTIESSEQLNLNQWYHLVGVWNASSISLYINGELEVEETFTIDAFKNSDGSLQIGAQITENYPGYGYFGFDGIIDQVSLYNSALTKEEIENHYIEYQP